MNYEEIKNRIGYLLIALAQPVTTGIHDYIHQMENQYIKQDLIEVRDALNELINDI